MSDVKLGELVDASAQRDAVHVAIAPVIAVERLRPGQHIGFITGSKDTVGSSSLNLIGVVDPFLKEDVLQGRRFWMFLYPKTITSLRHDWSHPAFEPQPAQPMTDKAFSEKWLENYVRAHCSHWSDKPDGGYSEFLRYVEVERWIYYCGSDCHNLGDVEDADELFRHLSVVLERRIDASYFEAFACSC